MADKDYKQSTSCTYSVIIFLVCKGYDPRCWKPVRMHFTSTFKLDKCPSLVSYVLDTYIRVYKLDKR